MVYIPFAETVADWRDAQEQLAQVMGRRYEIGADIGHAAYVQQREVQRCGLQLVRFWPAANDAEFCGAEAV